MCCVCVQKKKKKKTNNVRAGVYVCVCGGGAAIVEKEGDERLQSRATTAAADVLVHRCTGGAGEREKKNICYELRGLLGRG